MQLRAIVNGSNLYELKEGEPLMIPLTNPNAAATLRVTNGFHSSETVQLPYMPASTYFFKVDAVISNIALITIVVLSLLCFALYAFTGSSLVLMAANTLVLILVWAFFLQPSKAIVLKPWQPDSVS